MLDVKTCVAISCILGSAGPGAGGHGQSNVMESGIKQ